MRKMICLAFMAAPACAVLLACAQPPTPIQALPSGPTPEEVSDYARARAEYRAGLASGNGDIVMRATNTFSFIAKEILSRQDPRLFDAQMLCEQYRVTPPQDRRETPMTYEPQFAQDCERTGLRYNEATILIRRDLEAKIVAADRAIIAQAEAGHP
jgi:hypothetical protein